MSQTYRPRPASTPVADTRRIEAYEAIDLRPNSAARDELEEAVGHEAQHDVFNLTDHVGETPADLTPAMRTWFDLEVRARRKAALDTVAAQFGALSEGTRAAGVFLERQLDKIEDDRLIQKRQVLSSHRERNGAAYQTLVEARKAEENARIRYENGEFRNNRAPRMTPKWYVPALVLLLPAEGAINYETFMALEWMTPAIALGTVVIVGVVLALSAHLHGTLLRQARILFDPSQTDIDRLVGWRMFGIGTLALTVVMGVVTYARAAYFADLLRFQTVLGGEAPSALITIGGSLLGNFAVWLGGVILAFLVHDPDPDFPKSLVDWRTKSAIAKRMQESIEKPLQREFERIDAIAEREREQAENQHLAMSHLTGYQDARALFDRVVEQDMRVIGLLNAYRGRLVGAMRGQEVWFKRRRELDSDEAEHLTGSEYLALDLRLKYL